ncbi:hypothetical protein LDENG_00068100 [Lucifuga dentata]|nr:hypothetical protein LDENG_00068100 [Lucifuga dentata]
MCQTMAPHKRILRTLRNGPTRRNLFGPVDREQLQIEYQAALQKDLEEASWRWSFDFISEEPLQGGEFQWEGIPATKVPFLYRSCLLGHKQAQGQRTAEKTITLSGERVRFPQSEKENIPCNPERCPLSLEKTPEKSESTGVKRKQTNITDFYLAKRRVVWMPCKSGE